MAWQNPQPRLTVVSDGLLYTPSGPPTEDSIKSYLNPTGSCYDWEGGKGYFPLTLIGDLSAEFTPPFHVAVLDDPEWIPAGIPLPEWFGVLMVGFLLGASYMKRKYDGKVAA